MLTKSDLSQPRQTIVKDEVGSVVDERLGVKLEQNLNPIRKDLSSLRKDVDSLKKRFKLCEEEG